MITLALTCSNKLNTDFARAGSSAFLGPFGLLGLLGTVDGCAGLAIGQLLHRLLRGPFISFFLRSWALLYSLFLSFTIKSERGLL